MKIKAFEPGERFKEGKFVIEKAFLQKNKKESQLYPQSRNQQLMQLLRPLYGSSDESVYY